jgi:hypothetical protein
MTTVCCIDVGVKNLSICVMQKPRQVLYWDVCNIFGDEITCKSLLKCGRKCESKCSMKYTEDGDQHFTCKTHFPKNIIKSKKNIFKEKLIKDYPIQDLAKAIIKKISDIYDSNIQIFDLVSHIWLELQPKVNRKMMFVSHVLYAKLVEVFIDTATKINFIQATKKLKIYDGPNLQCNLKSPYSKRKWLSVEYCKYYLEPGDWFDMFISCNKRDDLSDSYLYCMYVLKYKKI